MKNIVFLLFLVINSFASISEVDKKLLEYNEEYINEMVDKYNKNLSNMNEFKKESIERLNKDVMEMVDKDILNVSDYKKAMEQAYQEAFKKIEIDRINQTINNIKEQYNYVTGSIFEQANKLIENIQNRNFSQLINDFKNFDLTFEIGGEGEGHVVQIFDGEIFSDSASNANNISTKSIQGFNCLCAGQLTNAFNSVDKHITMDNLNPINKGLEELILNIQNNKKEVVLQNEKTTVNNEKLKKEIANMELYLKVLKKEEMLIQ